MLDENPACNFLCGSELNNSELSIWYYNARSILPKLDELRLICASEKPDIVCIVETWVDDAIEDNELCVDGYNIVRLDRNRHGGGVLLYSKQCLSVRVLLNGPEDLELLGTLVNYCNKRLFLCLLYRPPSSCQSIFDKVSTILENLDSVYFSNFILLGDFNIDFCKFDHQQGAAKLYPGLSNLLSSFSLAQMMTEPTRLGKNGQGTLIDWVLTSSPMNIQLCTTVPPLVNSDHLGIKLTMNWTRRSYYANKRRKVWKYSLADFEKAAQLIDDTDWDELITNDVSQSFVRWQERFLDIMRECIPMTIVKKKETCHG